MRESEQVMKRHSGACISASRWKSARLAGKTFLWYTTELDELLHCDHVYVFRNGIFIDELTRSEVTEERIIQASFKEAG